jgi:hypothetical protein
MVKGLVKSVLKDDIRSTASKAIVVDLLGLSAPQKQFVKQALLSGVKNKTLIFVE